MDFIILVAIKLTIGFIALVLFMNLNGRSQLAPTSTEDQIGNYVLGGIIGGVIYSPNISIIQFLIVLSPKKEREMQTQKLLHLV